MQSESDLLRVSLALGARECGGPLTLAEEALARSVEGEERLGASYIHDIKLRIAAGEDPLGDAFCQIRSSVSRRDVGAFYTPESLIGPMVEWALESNSDRVVDAGCGSGRFARAVATGCPGVDLVAVDLDPLATLMTRAVLNVVGASCARVIQGDYTQMNLPQISGRTTFIGNPPYVRHHNLSPDAKKWAQGVATSLGHSISGLAGLHAFFFLATATHSQPGDLGCFVTSSEWLDVNYGKIVRSLLLDQLGGESIHIVEPSAMPFADATTTAAITTFRVGERPASIRMRQVQEVSALSSLQGQGNPVGRERLIEERRWTNLMRPPSAAPAGFVELGELCRVHRGAVTGSNATWILDHTSDLPLSVLFPAVTRAKELFTAGSKLEDDSRLKRVADLPADLDELDGSERRSVEKFISAAKRAGVHRGYVASHRRTWWSLGLKDPAPILATYMARQPPAFVLNDVAARHVNIAHGLYPREELDGHATQRLATALRVAARSGGSRVYAGGLMKWEPREMERLLVPSLAMLRSHDDLSSVLDALAT